MIKGRCFCGEVQFEIASEPRQSNHCHCISCQRASGAPFVTWLTFAAADFDVTHGMITERESSPGVLRGHCAACGTAMTWQSMTRSDSIDITAACFDDKSIVKPSSHIWMSHSPPWVSLDDDLPKHQEWSK
ncbi:MAG: GFA family protein [Woeseiaceae bacterium]|nr:GFA family protein [Woeseiaceae bacterium]